MAAEHTAKNISGFFAKWIDKRFEWASITNAHALSNLLVSPTTFCHGGEADGGGEVELLISTIFLFKLYFFTRSKDYLLRNA